MSRASQNSPSPPIIERSPRGLLGALFAPSYRPARTPAAAPSPRGRDLPALLAVLVLLGIAGSEAAPASGPGPVQGAATEAAPDAESSIGPAALASDAPASDERRGRRSGASTPARLPGRSAQLPPIRPARPVQPSRPGRLPRSGVAAGFLTNHALAPPPLV